MINFKIKKSILISLLVSLMVTSISFANSENDYEKAISQLLDRRGVEKQKKAETKLVKLGNKALPLLSVHFDDADVGGKLRILNVLKKIKSPDSQKLMLDKLKKECEKLSSGNTWGSQPEEAYIKRFLSFALQYMGEEIIPTLEEHIKIAKGEFKKRLIITAGMLGESKYYENISSYLKKDTDPFIRELAAFPLGNIKDKRVNGLLEKALKDEFFVELKPGPGSDSVPPSSRNKIYPVREAAVHSLQDLGVKVKRNGWDIQISR